MIKLLDSFIKYKSSYCSPETLRDYAAHLDLFFSWLNNNQINLLVADQDDLQNYILYLRSKKIKNVTVNTYYRSVKVFCSWLYRSGYIYTDIIQGVKLPRDDSNIIIPLTNEEVHNIDSYFLGYKVFGLRNYCIFHLLLDCGMRRQEVINLKWNDVQHNNIIIRNSKFNKSRITLLPDFLFQSLNNYRSSLSFRSEFVFVEKSGSQLSTDAFKKCFANIKKHSGVPRVYAHLCRHTFATSYLYFGGNMEMLRLLLGHSDYSVTQKYVHLSALSRLSDSDIYKIDDIFIKK